MIEIDWKRVNAKLICPICGDEAHIEAGTDGTRGIHTHSFPVSRVMARRLSTPTREELEHTIHEARQMLDEVLRQEGAAP